MIQKFKALLTRFRRDENGAFLVLFGVLALVLIATSGAVVDFSAIEQARTRAQVALDAAALGLQPHVFDTSPVKNVAWFKTQAQALLDERLYNPNLAASDQRISIVVNDAIINVRDGQLELKARVTTPTYFVALVGIDNVSARLVSEVTRKRLNIEVAMVLDNSGSMSSKIEQYVWNSPSRMSVLIDAATLATDTLFDNQATLPNVFVSIIPFTAYVNVGTANKTAAWMSQTGASSVSSLPFDDDDNEATPFNGTVNPWTLYSGFNNKSWKGCVQARIGPYDANDTTPNNGVPDTMFQPLFDPDGPQNNYLSDTGGSCTRIPPVWTWTRTRVNCTGNGNNNKSNFNNCSSSNQTNSYTQKDAYGANVSPAATSQPANQSAASYYNDANCSDSYTSVQTSWGWGGNRWSNTRTRTCTYDFTANEMAQRLCKYTGATYWGDGPNADCPNTAILPLSNVRATVNARIAAMVADGSTNIEQGTVWGLHSLSSNEPLTEARSYDEATSKVLIVMTDGTNNVKYDSYSNTPYGGGWMAWGYRKHKRLLTESTTPKDSVASGNQVIAEVNRRTLLACTEAKNAGITVYTIGLDSANNATTTTMMQNCATPTKTENGVTTVYSYFPTTAAALLQVFKDIAAQLSELRIAK